MLNNKDLLVYNLLPYLDKQTLNNLTCTHCEKYKLLYYYLTYYKIYTTDCVKQTLKQQSKYKILNVHAV